MRIVYNRANFSKIFYHLKSLLGVSISLIDFEKNVHICGSPKKKEDFCERINQIPELQEKCQNCVKNLLDDSQKSGQFTSCFCHAGLYEAVFPIMSEDVIIGYISYGQIRGEQSVYPPVCTDDKVFQDTYNKIPFFSDDQLENLRKLVSRLQLSHNILVTEEDGLMPLITTYIKENLQEDLSTKSLCHMFDVSKNYLYKHFQELYGTGINEYIILRRIASAKNLLRETDDLVYEIAQKVGFHDCAYFSKIFKNIVGITPNQYRKQSS